MKLTEFRELVKNEFGEGLKHATPANVRDFIDRLETDKHYAREGARIVIDEPCSTYEEVLKDFFGRILELPPEQAMIQLYTVALDLAFAGIESHYAERFASLFHEIDREPPL